MNAIELYQNNFQFLTQDVRIATDAANNPWFCAKDVCDLLDITWNGSTLENMPEQWKGMLKVRTPSAENGTGGGAQNLIFINEPGLFRLTFRSTKPVAVSFCNWVCETVLPEIRRTGSFGQVSVKDEIILCKRIDELSLELLLDRLRRTCNLAKQPMPSLELLSQTIDQRDLFAGE